MSLTTKGKKGERIRKKLALAMATNARSATLKDASDGKTGEPERAEPRKAPRTAVKHHGGDSAEHKDGKFPLEERRRFGFVSGTEGETSETRTVNQPVRGTVLPQATKIPQKSPALGRASLIPQRLDKSEKKYNKSSLADRDRKATGLIEERQMYDHSFHASNDFVPPGMRTSSEASHATRLDRSRSEAGNTKTTHAADAGVSSFRGKTSDEPIATPSPPTTDINTIEKEVGRLKFDMHRMLEDFQNLNAFALKLEQQVKDVRRDRLEMTSS